MTKYPPLRMAALFFVWTFALLPSLRAVFIHPGCLYSQADLERMKANQTTEPWKTALANFASRSTASLTYTMRGPFSTVTTDPGSNSAQFDNDMTAVRDQAIMWYITQNQVYARKAIQILDAYSNTLMSLGGHDVNLLAGNNGISAANGAEILRYSNAGWSAAGIEACRAMFNNVFWPNLKDLQDGNVGAAQMKTIIAIAVFNDDQAKFDYAVNNFRSNHCSSLIADSLPTGQNAEAGRDQAHCWGGVHNFAFLAQIAWNQGIDLFSEGNNRLEAAAEYWCAYNLLNLVPFQTFGRCRPGYTYTSISDASRGTVTWANETLELLYAHYAMKRGYHQLPYTLLYRDTKANQNGMGVLFYRLAGSLPAAPNVPQSVTTTAVGTRQVQVSWAPVAGAKSYTVMRSTTSGWIFGEVVASGLIGNTYIDRALAASTTYYYVVSADSVTGKSGYSAQSSVTTPFDPNWIAVNSAGASEGVFQKDDYYAGGSIGQRINYVDRSGVSQPAPMYAYETERWGAFSYTFPGLNAGAVYKVRLHFAESTYLAVGSRKFNVIINGTEALSHYDIFAETGAAFKAVVKEFTATPDSGGRVVVQYVGVVGNPIAKAIEVVAATPPAPTRLAAIGGNAQVSLSWASSNGATRYAIKRSSQMAGPFVLLGNVSGTSFTDTTAINGTTYYYVVSAGNDLGQSSDSPKASAAPRLPPPAVPTGLAAQARNAQVALSWAASPGATAYNIKRATLRAGPYTTVSNSKAPYYTDLKTVNGATYFYVVSAVNEGGESGDSTIVSVVPEAGSLLNLATGGTATASRDNPPNETAAGAFDGLSNTKWYNFPGSGEQQSAGWLQYHFAGSTAWAVTRYGVTSANDLPPRDPKNWKLQGSNDGTTWTTVDTQVGQAFSARHQQKNYSISNRAAYQYYRLAITENSGGSGFGIQVAEFTLMAP